MDHVRFTQWQSYTDQTLCSPDTDHNNSGSLSTEQIPLLVACSHLQLTAHLYLVCTHLTSYFQYINFFRLERRLENDNFHSNGNISAVYEIFTFSGYALAEAEITLSGRSLSAPAGNFWSTKCKVNFLCICPLQPSCKSISRHIAHRSIIMYLMYSIYILSCSPVSCPDSHNNFSVE